jgi:hypothetical protein
MVEGKAVREQLRAMAAVLTGVRGRLAELCADLPEEEAELEGEEGSPGLRSVVLCILTDSLEPAIRDLLAASEPECQPAPAASSKVDAPGYSSLFRRLEVKLPKFLARGQSERREADELIQELTSIAGAERPAALEDARFHRLTLVDRLLERAQDALPSDPAGAEDLATLAAAIAERLANVEESIEGRVHAVCTIAKARRIGGQIGAAEGDLSEATLYAASSEEHAHLSRALALLRWEQGRLDDAAALLERAAELWAAEDWPQEEAACRVLRGLLTLDEGKVADAVWMVRDALPLLVDPWLLAYGGLVFALGLAERGQATAARQQREESAKLVPLIPMAAVRFARQLEAKIALSLGELVAAETELEELRQQALEERWLPEAAVATLDLARLDVERMGGAERWAAASQAQRKATKRATKKRVAELESTFAGVSLEGVAAALRGFPDQLPAGESLQGFTAALMAVFLRVLRLRGVRSAPLPFI